MPGGRLPLAGGVLVALALASTAAAADLQARFERTSYVPGQVARLHLDTPSSAVTLQVIRAGVGATGSSLGGTVSDPARLTARDGAVDLRVHYWPSGVYLARIRAAGSTAYAPFVVRARFPGRTRVAIVLPTLTWQAYNFRDGGSWYADPAVTTVDLARAFLPPGLPPHFRDYDLGFLRWLDTSGSTPDVYTDEDLDRVPNAAWLARTYDLVVFAGHEEYVTRHEFDLVESYRDLGGNLAFLSANNFFRHVERRGRTMALIGRWRDEGRPESALVGVQYVDWYRGTYANIPFVVTGAAAAPWLFKGTGLGNGSRFGDYGIEVDSRTDASPRGTQVLAQLPGIFGPGVTGEMTYYETPGGAKVFAAGAMNFGASTYWPLQGRLMRNLWAELARP